MYQSTLRKLNQYNLSSSFNVSESNDLQVETAQFYLEPYMFPILLVIFTNFLFNFIIMKTILQFDFKNEIRLSDFWDFLLLIAPIRFSMRAA